MSSFAPDAGGPAGERPRVRISDPGVMRALAHQARLAILEHLTTHEAATATECAAICGLSPSATSYHLRALAKVDLVEQAPGRGDGRERLWRSAIKGFMIGAEAGPDPDPEVRAAERELVDAFLIKEEARTRNWLAHQDREPPEWYRVATLSEAIIEITADELGQLTEEMVELARRYRKPRRGGPPDGARTVSVVLRAFPIDEPPDPQG